MEVTLDARGIGILVTLFMGWSAFLVGVVKWLIGKLLAAHTAHIDERFEQMNKDSAERKEEYRALRSDLDKLRDSLPREYVRRDDWIMGFSRVDQKLDAIWKFVHQLRDKV